MFLSFCSLQKVLFGPCTVRFVMKKATKFSFTDLNRADKSSFSIEYIRTFPQTYLWVYFVWVLWTTK
eukprot:UN01794